MFPERESFGGEAARINSKRLKASPPRSSHDFAAPLPKTLLAKKRSSQLRRLKVYFPFSLA